ncbi:unnamed protein product, partial [Mesorhabditis belari]|uniref:Gustatory receptor n=1 Tax=Mesorhabditis belari TaxID=2138241 RepID=A0AAF3FLI7_9BILA
MDSKARRSSYNEANCSPGLYVRNFGKTIFENSSMKSKDQPVKNGKLFAADGCYLLDRDVDDKSEKQFHEFQKVLTWMGFLFDVSSRESPHFLQRLWLGFFLFTSVYTVIYDLFFLFSDFHANLAPSTMVVSAITFQASLSLIFLLRWQKNLNFHHFFHVHRHSKICGADELDMFHKRVHSGNRKLFWGLQIYSIITMFIFYVAIWSGLLAKLVHPSFFRLFYFNQSIYVRPLFFVLYLSLVVYNLATYLCLTNAVHCELKKFNYKITQLNTLPSELMRSNLESLILEHTQITKCIQAMDELYKVYAFSVTACVIPLTIFVLTLVLTRSTLTELLISLPTVAFCTFELYAIMYSSKISDELSKSKTLLCTNHNVWIPYDECLNKIATTLAIHLDQPDLGITLWGFTRVTKPLILTIVSGMMTCLAFLLDLKPTEETKDCNCASNNTIQDS